jgi:hypothetical protein
MAKGGTKKSFLFFFLFDILVDTCVFHYLKEKI